MTAADELVLDDLVLRTVCVGPMENQAYLLTCRRTGAQLLVDAAAEPDRLLELVRTGSPGRLDLVVTTHRHADHLGALAAMLAATGAPHAAGAADAHAVAAAAGTTTPRALRHGDVLAVGDLRLEVIALRGHTPGAIALAYREPGVSRHEGAVAGRVHLLTGDSLFPGGPGRTTSPADFTSLMDDLEQRVFARFGDDTCVHPGHGRGTTLGAERPSLGVWRSRGW
ncbi:MBL fold metallo-hydrolase [Cellulomonas hominis]|uniref:MBL fold metallo-hydrolase n=1 Tax=Cellulomonas hominis TaxID=156981 RepID=UPI001B93703B|nr:MBL fold metallo-hydrolase [Cellulomonas hominis]VTR76269.1 Hydroxyacylglutathione hydrolase GloC [Cellulomonas hominis]